MSVGLTLALLALLLRLARLHGNLPRPLRPKPDLAPSSLLTEFNKNENGFYLPFRVT